MSRRSTARRILSFVGCTVGALAMFLLLTVGMMTTGPWPVDHRHQRADRTRLDIGNLETATGFAALVDLGIIDKEPRDGWGNPYRYELVDGRPIVTSFGSDGHPGGKGDAADISSSPRIAARP